MESFESQENFDACLTKLTQVSLHKISHRILGTKEQFTVGNIIIFVSSFAPTVMRLRGGLAHFAGAPLS